MFVLALVFSLFLFPLVAIVIRELHWQEEIRRNQPKSSPPIVIRELHWQEEIMNAVVNIEAMTSRRNQPKSSPPVKQKQRRLFRLICFWINRNKPFSDWEIDVIDNHFEYLKTAGFNYDKPRENNYDVRSKREQVGGGF